MKMDLTDRKEFQTIVKYLEGKYSDLGKKRRRRTTEDKPKQLIQMINTIKRYLAINSDEPWDCRMEFVDEICPDCEFLNVEQVSHPGGDSKCLVDKLTCTLGHWEDDF